MTELKLPLKQRKRLLDDVLKKSGDVSTVQVLRWLNRARCAAEAVVETPMDGYKAAVFWISIFGVLHDLRLSWDSQLAMLRGIHAEGDATAGQRERLKILYGRPLRHLLEAVKLLKSCFTEDELIYLEYRRNCEAHPFQHAYRLRPTKDKTAISDKRRVHLLGREMVVEHIDAATERVMLAHPPNENMIAKSLAERSAPLIASVERAWLAWNA